MKSILKKLKRWKPRWNEYLLICCSLLTTPSLDATEPAPTPTSFTFKKEAKVDSQGIFLNGLLEGSPILPRILIAPSPAWGRTTALKKSEILSQVAEAAPDLAKAAYSGAELIHVSRAMRTLEEEEIRTLLQESLQEDKVRDRGELELRFSRAWTAIPIPDEPFLVKFLDLPVAGITPHFMARIELRTATEMIGTYSVGLKARVLKEIWVAASPITRRQLVSNADFALEKRDVLPLREALAQFDPQDSTLEIMEPVQSGNPIFARALKARTVVHRGKVVDALVQDGALIISAKVEVLEEGSPGQFVRVRNLKSRKEFRGKVQNEETVLVNL